MNRKVILAIGLVLALSFGGLVIKRLNDKKEREEALKNLKPPVTPVSLVKPQIDKMSEFFTASGTIIPLETLEIIPKVSGKILSLNVKEGDTLRQGELIAQIENIDVNNQILQAKAQVDSAKANLDLLVNGPLKEQIKQSESSVNQAKANLEQLKVRLKFSESELVRNKKLFQDEVITKQQLDNVQNQVDVLRKDINTLEQQIIYSKETLKITKIGTREEQIRVGRASYNQSLAYLKTLQDQLNYYYITSPITGVVTKKSVEEGMFVSPPTSILTLSKNSTLEAEISIPERYLPKVKLGQKATIKFDSIPDIYLKITKISPTIDSINHIFKAKAIIENPSEVIKQGMSFECQVIFNEKSSAMLLPSDAIITSEGKKIVYLIGKDKKVVEKEVNIGVETTEKTEVISGIEVDESVILEGNSFIKAGDLVEVEKL
jgi:HlyD family secretion protein